MIEGCGIKLGIGLLGRMRMFSWLKSSTLNFMLAFINFVFAIILNSPLNGVVCVFCFLIAMAMRTEEVRRRESCDE